MSNPLDLSRYPEALRAIPPRFQELAREYVAQVAAKIEDQCPNDPSLMANVRDNAIECALTGLAQVRWYLLYKPERADAAEAAWRADGVSGLCLHMRELHQAEKTLLVCGYGHTKAETVAARLDALQQEHGFTMVATSHGYAAAHVKLWAQGAGLQYTHFALPSDRESRDRLISQYYVLLDRLTPKAVCVMTDDPVAMNLAAFAARKRVPTISSPTPVPSAITDHMPSWAADRSSVAMGTPVPADQQQAKAFTFTALMKGGSPEP